MHQKNSDKDKKALRIFYLILKSMLIVASRIIAFFLILFIRLIRPMLGPSNICPFTIGCTPFALDQLSTQPLHKAFLNIFKRLIQCHPFGKRIS